MKASEIKENTMDVASFPTTNYVKNSEIKERIIYNKNRNTAKKQNWAAKKFANL